MEVQLKHSEIWKEFSNLGTEMILTKRGRNLFPIPESTVKGLESNMLYLASLQLLTAEGKIYRYSSGKWSDLNETSIDGPLQIVGEAFSGKAKTGAEIMRHGITFKNLKITNSLIVNIPGKEVIRLQSMRKYVPILIIRKISTATKAEFRFKETAFIAVTAYQNRAITDLKILHNKYASGFGIKKRLTTSDSSQLSVSSTCPSPAIKKPKVESVSSVSTVKSSSSSSDEESKPSVSSFESPQQFSHYEPDVKYNQYYPYPQIFAYNSFDLFNPFLNLISNYNTEIAFNQF